MLVDFCHHCLGSKIKSDKVSFDGYEVTNLLSCDFSLKNKGFLSDHFIKPPVNVTLQFPCNVSIYRIIIDPVIGRQQSCDIKLFTGTKTISTSWLYGNDDDCPVNTDGLLMNSVGFVTSLEPHIICFQNPFFRERHFWKIDNLSDSFQYPIRSELKGRKSGSISNVSHLNICVTRVRSGGSVAIKRLEVWGMPSTSVSFAAQQHLLEVYRKTLSLGLDRTVREQTEADASTFQETDKVSEESNYTIEDGVKIPEDFIDQITFEVMSLPMILPSGKNIDQSTLERFVNTEASWGRAPSDPFTGVVFSPGHQAIPNVALKARLDQFLIKHSHKLKIPRTLGRPDSTVSKHEIKTSRLVAHNTSSELTQDRDQTTSSCATVTKGRNKRSDGVIHNSGAASVNYHDEMPQQGRKRKWLDSCNRQEKNTVSFAEPTKRLNTAEHTSDAILKTWNTSVESSTSECKSGYPAENFRFKECVSGTKNPYKTISNLTEGPADTKNKKNTLKHSCNLSISLDSALNDVLSNLPSFTTFRSTKGDSDHGVVAIVCCICQRDIENDNITKYRLPCKHYICRKCAQQNKISKCKMCNSKFSSEQLARVF